MVLSCAGGPRKRRAVKLEGDSRVFAEGALPAAPGGGGLTTYRELCGTQMHTLCMQRGSYASSVPNGGGPITYRELCGAF